jgi:hypothetical protein
MTTCPVRLFNSLWILPVLGIRILNWIRIRRIRKFLGLLDPDPDPLVSGTDPYPAQDPAPDPSLVL